jgi:hypothetical protein
MLAGMFYIVTGGCQLPQEVGEQGTNGQARSGEPEAAGGVTRSLVLREKLTSNLPVNYWEVTPPPPRDMKARE